MRVFLDHAATTPLCASARKAAERWLDAGNPSALYQEGRDAKAAIDEAREIISDRLGVEFGEIIFTGSGTEAAVLATVGSAIASQAGAKRRVVFSAAEHHCVLHTAPFLTALGFEPILAPVDRFGRVRMDALRQILSAGNVLLVAAMHVNNELGTFNSTAEIGEICRAEGALFFCDAVQSFGKVPFAASDLNADMISLSAHKIYGPKGVGALYVKAGTQVKPVIKGGGQERELRGGTENVAAIAGFGAAVAQIDLAHSPSGIKHILRGHLLAMGAVSTVPEDVPQVDSHLHVRLPGVKAESFLIALDRQGVSAGSGAACASGSIDPSHVLLAAGYSGDEAKEGVRFTMGAPTGQKEIEFAVQKIDAALKQIGYKIPAGT